ncbi:hypothetical protein C3F00_032755 [Pseudomonas sp. MWU13-2860]|nr:hypothetical protein C3F00_032755 [Pseudomonas sp. MWU13-2860]
MNAVVLAVLVMMALSLSRVPVVLALILSAAIGGIYAGMSPEAVVRAFNGGLGAGAPVALAYATLGAFAIALSRTGIVQGLSGRIVGYIHNGGHSERMLRVVKWSLLACLVLAGFASGTVIPVHIAFSPILVPPLLLVMNRLRLDRRAVACAITFSITVMYMTMPIGFGSIFLNDILVGNINKAGAASGFQVGLSAAPLAMLIPASGMVFGLALALLFLWLSLWLLERQLIAPAFSRSQRTLESEDLNRTMVRTAPAGLALYAIEDARIILQNRVMDDWERQSKHGATFQSLLRAQPISPGEYGNDALDRLIQLELDDGATLDLHVHAVHSKYLGVAVLLCHVVDVTAIKTTERKLDEARKKAEEANRAKSQFLAVMSHEIRTPLYGVFGNLELLKHSALDPQQQGYVQAIQNSSPTLLGLINDVLDVSRIEAGQLRLEAEPFSLFDLVHETVHGYAASALSKGLWIYACVDPRFCLPVRGDPHKVRQILNNLLSNAVKFTDSGRIVVRCSV